jgi:transcriptional regulator with XRE-family HTH domain
MTEKNEEERFKQKVIEGFGQHIIKLKLSKNITSAKLAQLSNLTASNLSRLENGKANPTLLSLIKLAHALDITLESLMKDYDIR